MINDRQKELVAWAIATEGSFCLMKTRGKGRTVAYIPRVDFHNNDIGLVMRFSSLVMCGKIYPVKQRDNNKAGWAWILQGIRGNLKEFLEEIIPFLPSKRKQAEILLEFINIRRGVSRKGVAMKLGQNTLSGREEELRSELLKLNRRGVV